MAKASQRTQLLMAYSLRGSEDFRPILGSANSEALESLPQKAGDRRTMGKSRPGLGPCPKMPSLGQGSGVPRMVRGI